MAASLDGCEAVACRSLHLPVRSEARSEVPADMHRVEEHNARLGSNLRQNSLIFRKFLRPPTSSFLAFQEFPVPNARR